MQATCQTPNVLTQVSVTCADPRCVPEQFLGLKAPETVVMRAAGGRVAGILNGLLALDMLLGGFRELMIIHHTGRPAQSHHSYQQHANTTQTVVPPTSPTMACASTTRKKAPQPRHSKAWSSAVSPSKLLHWRNVSFASTLTPALASRPVSVMISLCSRTSPWCGGSWSTIPLATFSTSRLER